MDFGAEASSRATKRLLTVFFAAPAACWCARITVLSIAQHELISENINSDHYFAHPYCSWERGANENMNGLICQFFPKKMRFEVISEGDILWAMNSLNHRPRKCLGFKTQHQVFMK